MRLAFAILLVGHGLLHLLGFAKAFEFAALPQLTRPISPFMGVLWLAAAMLFLLTAGALFVWPRWWWAIGVLAIAFSMVAIVPSWADAKFGALANLLALVGVVFGFLVDGPFSQRAAYEREVERRLGPTVGLDVLTDADVAPLPAPVQRYLVTSGVVGQPRVRNFRARMHGRIRQDPDSRWMTFTAEQHNFYDAPARLFYMDASMLLVPVQVFHRYVHASATMQAKVTGLVPVADMSGPEMMQAETVTLITCTRAWAVPPRTWYWPHRQPDCRAACPTTHPGRVSWWTWSTQPRAVRLTLTRFPAASAAEPSTTAHRSPVISAVSWTKPGAATAFRSCC